MGGIGDQGTLIEDWLLPPTPSPRALMSSLLNEDFSSVSFSDLIGENGGDKHKHEFEKEKLLADLKEEGIPGNKMMMPFRKDLSLEPSLFGAAATHKSNAHSPGSLAERRAATAGFNILKIDTSLVSPTGIATSSAEVRSPYLTIPPGLSPTMLLESPVFLTNAMVQPSPTTGKLPFVLNNNTNPMTFPVLEKTEDVSFDDFPESFSFKPYLDSKPPCFSTEDKGANIINQWQSSSNIGNPVQLENKSKPNQQELENQTCISDGKDITDLTIPGPKASDSLLSNDHPSPDELDDAEVDQNGEHSSAAIGAPVEDGYKWRKYGQKQVKNSKYPRSYYKCTHTNCPVKKKVERSQEGHVTEIIYKAAHNHPKPPPNRLSGVAFPNPCNEPEADDLANHDSQGNLNHLALWGTAQNGTLQDTQGDCQDSKPSASLASKEFSDATLLESQDAMDVSSTVSNEEDHRATHGNVTLDCDGEEDETESKRRKLDACAIDMGNAASRAVREPRVVVQTTSEVDILDDGYRWRKYGQKVVKGNPNPRSYYKCTYPGCSVRKHVERASHDLKSVITTYEGKHNHEVPVARNNGQASYTAAAAQATAPQYHNLHHRQESAHNSSARFNAAAPFNTLSLPASDQLGPGGNFSFGMVVPRLTSLQMPRLGPVAQPKMAGIPPMMQAYLLQRQARGAGLMMPKGEPKEETASESGPPVANANSSAYQQLMSRLPTVPQM